MWNPLETVFGLARRVIDVVTPGSSGSNGESSGSAGPAPVTPPPRLREVTDRARRTAGHVADATTGAVSSAATMVRDRVTGDHAEQEDVTREIETGGDVVTAVSGTDQPGPGVAYEQWTKAQLYERAQELDIQGRSQMTKDELVAALRDAN